MKMLIVILALGMSACDKQTAANVATQLASGSPTTPTTTSLEGQVYYTMSEIVNGTETEDMTATVGGYRLDNLRVYFIGKRDFKLLPDYDGNFGIDGIEAGTYQVIIKSTEVFTDTKGDYTYQGSTSFRVKDGIDNIMPTINVQKKYLTTPDPTLTPHVPDVVVVDPVVEDPVADPIPVQTPNSSGNGKH